MGELMFDYARIRDAQCIYVDISVLLEEKSFTEPKVVFRPKMLDFIKACVKANKKIYLYDGEYCRISLLEGPVQDQLEFIGIYKEKLRDAAQVPADKLDVSLPSIAALASKICQDNISIGDAKKCLQQIIKLINADGVGFGANWDITHGGSLREFVESLINEKSISGVRDLLLNAEAHQERFFRFHPGSISHGNSYIDFCRTQFARTEKTLCTSDDDFSCDKLYRSLRSIRKMVPFAKRDSYNNPPAVREYDDFSTEREQQPQPQAAAATGGPANPQRPRAIQSAYQEKYDNISSEPDDDFSTEREQQPPAAVEPYESFLDVQYACRGGYDNFSTEREQQPPAAAAAGGPAKRAVQHTTGGGMSLFSTAEQEGGGELTKQTCQP
jgi:hypothetical protein